MATTTTTATTTTLGTLIDRLSDRVGDYIEEKVTTPITTNVNVICATLLNRTNRDGAYNRYWLYIKDGANAGDYRRVETYTSSTGLMRCLGLPFVSDGAELATFQLHKYDRQNKIKAINKACRDIRHEVFRVIQDKTITVDEDSYEYELSEDFQNPLSHITAVDVEIDESRKLYLPVYDWNIKDDGSSRYLVIRSLPAGKKLRLEGYTPLESGLSEPDETVTIQDPHTDLLVEYAAYALFELESNAPSNQDKSYLQSESIRLLASYNTLKKSLRMPKPQARQRFGR